MGVGARAAPWQVRSHLGGRGRRGVACLLGCGPGAILIRQEGGGARRAMGGPGHAVPGRC